MAAFTAIGYWLLGYLGSIYAIPPGFASPIWPAAGFAVFASLVWGRACVSGVFLASLILNLQFAQGNSASLVANALTSVLIAAGVAAQTLVAHSLVLRFTHYPNLVSRATGGLLLGVLCGPVACVISATIGVITLLSFNVITSHDFLRNWLHWWTGDSIGAMVFAPVILAFNIRNHHGKGIQLFGFLSFYFLLACVASAVFFNAKNQDLANTHSLFSERTKGYVTALDKQLDSAMDTAQSVVAVFESFNRVDYDGFMRFSDSLYSHIPGTQALSWIPIVSHDERRAYEANLLNINGRAAHFFKKDSTNGNVAVEPKELYFPVYYIYPLTGNAAAIGFDLSSHPGRESALKYAKSTGKQVATEPIDLVQETESQKAFLLFSPIERADTVVGFVSMVYRVSDLVGAALSTQTLEQYSVNILDVTAADAMPLMVSMGEQSQMTYRHTIHFAQRQWQVTFQPSIDEIAKLQSWWVPFILVFAFIFVTLLGLLVLMILSRTAAIQHEVDIKTLALSKALDQAKLSSEVKTAFLASMSHELRTPLNSIIGFSRRLMKALQGQVDERYMNSLDAIHRNGNALLTMINDILDLSKVEAGKLSVNKAPVAVNEVVKEVFEGLNPIAEDAGVRLVHQASPVALVPLDRQRFSQIVINFVNNAIKFSEQGDCVTLVFRERDHEGIAGVELEVRDTGVGIDEANLSRLFQRYEQLGDTFQGGKIGTGLGLALVRELVELHGGRVYVESQLGEGSAFFAWFPLHGNDRPDLAGS